MSEEEEAFVARMAKGTFQRLLSCRLFHGANDVAEKIRHVRFGLVGGSLREVDGFVTHGHQAFDAGFVDAAPSYVIHREAVHIFEIQGFGYGADLATERSQFREEIARRCWGRGLRDCVQQHSFGSSTVFRTGADGIAGEEDALEEIDLGAVAGDESAGVIADATDDGGGGGFAIDGFDARARGAVVAEKSGSFSLGPTEPTGTVQSGNIFSAMARALSISRWMLSAQKKKRFASAQLSAERRPARVKYWRSYAPMRPMRTRPCSVMLPILIFQSGQGSTERLLPGIGVAMNESTGGTDPVGGRNKPRSPIFSGCWRLSLEGLGRPGRAAGRIFEIVIVSIWFQRTENTN